MSGQHLAGHRVDLIDGDVVDALQGVGNGAVLAVVEFTAAEAIHPGRRIFQSEHQRTAQRTLGDPALAVGDAVAGHRLKHLVGQSHHLVESFRQATGIDGEGSAVRERVDGRIHRVGQATGLSDLLEQPRTQATAQSPVEHRQRPAVFPTTAGNPNSEAHMALLGIAVDQYQTGPARQSAGSGARRHRRAVLCEPGTEVSPHQRNDVVVVDIAGHRHHHPFRDVAPNVEGLQLISCHRRHGVDAADHRPAQRMVAEHRR